MMARIKAPHLLTGAVVLGLAGFALPRLLPGAMPAVATAVVFGAALLLAFVALLRGGLTDSCDVAPAALNRRYTRELMLAMGASAETQHAIGTGVFGGMVSATVLAVFFVPVFFVFVMGLQERFDAWRAARPARRPQAQEESAV